MLRDRLLTCDTCPGPTRMIGVLLLAFTAITQTSADPASPITILAVEGQVEYLLRGADRWLPAQNPQLLPKPQILRPGDRIQTGPNARTVLRWSDQSIVRLGPLTDLEILDPPSPTAEHGFSFWRGLLYFLHRERPADLKFRTRHVTAAVRGTEFHLESERIPFEEDSAIVLRSLDERTFEDQEVGGDFAVDLVAVEMTARAEVDEFDLKLVEAKPDEEEVDASLPASSGGFNEPLETEGAEGWA